MSEGERREPRESQVRCFDCLADIAVDAPRFAVLKKLRDSTPVAGESLHPAEAAMVESLCHDPVVVCADCAGWYGDHPISLTVEESREV